MGGNAGAGKEGSLLYTGAALSTQSNTSRRAMTVILLPRMPVYSYAEGRQGLGITPATTFVATTRPEDNQLDDIAFEGRHKAMLLVSTGHDALL